MFAAKKEQKKVSGSYRIDVSKVLREEVITNNQRNIIIRDKPLYIQQI